MKYEGQIWRYAQSCFQIRAYSEHSEEFDQPAYVHVE